MKNRLQTSTNTEEKFNTLAYMFTSLGLVFVAVAL